MSCGNVNSVRTSLHEYRTCNRSYINHRHIIFNASLWKNPHHSCDASAHLRPCEVQSPCMFLSVTMHVSPCYRPCYRSCYSSSPYCYSSSLFMLLSVTACCSPPPSLLVPLTVHVSHVTVHVTLCYRACYSLLPCMLHPVTHADTSCSLYK